MAVRSCDDPALWVRERTDAGADDTSSQPEGLLRKVRVDGKSCVCRMRVAVGGEFVYGESVSVGLVGAVGAVSELPVARRITL